MISRPAGRRLVIAGFWTLFAAISTVQIQISMLSHHHSWARVFTYQLVVWSLWIAFTFAIGRLVRAVPPVPLKPVAVLAHALMAFALGFLHMALWVATEFVLVPYDVMNPIDFGLRFRSVATFQMPLELLIYVLVVVGLYAERLARTERERERKAAQLEASLAHARLLALELQTQPHFLFNTLNGIGALVRANRNPEALSMISGLSDLLRYALDRSSGAMVALEEEVGTVGRYLEIQRIRFADRLSYQTALAPDTRNAAMPALLLQPLVENAVRHGISRSEAPGRIAVRAARVGESVVIEIFNTGRLDAAFRSGIGLSTTLARLAELYGERAHFELAEHDGGVMARVTLPFREAP